MDLLRTNLNPSHQRMLCAKIGCNIGSVVLEMEEEFLNFVNVFLLICYYLPLEKGLVPSFEQTWIPFTKECFVPSFVEIGPVVLEKKILKFCEWFSLFSIIYPWTWIPITKGCFAPTFVEIGPVVLEKKIFLFRQSIFAIS